jgi:hypothetical protein
MGDGVDIPKTKQLILYICQRMEDGPEFGSTVLNKVLYYVDHVHYLRNGQTITGMTYVKQQAGPTPAPREFLPLRQEMIDKGWISIKEREYLGRLQKRPVAKTSPDLSVFKPWEVAVIDKIIDVFKGINAITASEISHSELGWQLAETMEEIPPYTYLLSEGELTEEDIAWAKEAIKEYLASIH